MVLCIVSDMLYGWWFIALVLAYLVYCVGNAFLTLLCFFRFFRILRSFLFVFGLMFGYCGVLNIL